MAGGCFVRAVVINSAGKWICRMPLSVDRLCRLQEKGQIDSDFEAPELKLDSSRLLRLQFEIGDAAGNTLYNGEDPG